MISKDITANRDWATVVKSPDVRRHAEHQPIIPEGWELVPTGGLFMHSYMPGATAADFKVEKAGDIYSVTLLNPTLQTRAWRMAFFFPEVKLDDELLITNVIDGTQAQYLVGMQSKGTMLTKYDLMADNIQKEFDGLLGEILEKDPAAGMHTNLYTPRSTGGREDYTAVCVCLTSNNPLIGTYTMAKPICIRKKK